VILALAAVLVIAVAVPALGSGGTLFGLATHANNKAERALHRSKRALKRASRGLKRGHNARLLASAVSQTVDSARVQSAVASGPDSTNIDTSFQDLGGPRLAVTVPSSGLIEVWAQVTMSDDGTVSLYQDGQPMPGQSQFCDSTGSNAGALMSSSAGQPITIATPGTLGIICGTDGAPGPVLFKTSAGQHTYELRYATCGCAGSVDFTDRKLFVAPRL